MATYPDLVGKIALVTGASAAIGSATARALAANGARVVAVGRNAQALQATVALITGRGGHALAAVTDCTQEQELAALRDRLRRELGVPDVLVPFAGGNGMPVATAAESGSHWREVVEINLTSTFLTVAAFLPDLLERGSGAIVTMSSAAARQAAQSSAAYAAAKAGVIGFSRHLAGEVAAAGIRVNCLAPSAIETERLRRWVPEQGRRELAAAFPLGRLGQPYDVAAATLFLASDASSWITGVTFDVAGGKIMP